MPNEKTRTSQSRRTEFTFVGVFTAILLIFGCLGGFVVLQLFQKYANAAPPIIGQNCGAMSVSEDVSGYATGSPSVEDCLWHAYQASCQTATLDVGYFGIDTNTDYYLTVQKQHGICAVTDASQFHMASGNRTGAVMNHACGGLLHQFGGLVAYACGSDDNIIVPHLSATTNGSGVPQLSNALSPCGTLVVYVGQARAATAAYTTNDATRVTNCFAASWTTTCAPQQLVLVRFTRQDVVQQTFTISIARTAPCQRVLTLATQARTLTIPPSDISVVTCAGLTSNAAGLSVSGCGTNPPLAIPASSGADTYNDPYPPYVGQNCAPFAARDYRACFWQAYQTCQSATISTFFTGYPATVIDSVTAQSSHGQCMLTAHLQFGAPYDVAALSLAAETATCASARQQDNEIVVSGCGAFGDLIFP